jgi:hypothetical protein
MKQANIEIENDEIHGGIDRNVEASKHRDRK